MSGFKLYEVDSMYRQALDAAEQYINQDTGEIPEDWAKFMDDVGGERENKLLACGLFQREMQAEAEAMENEARRMALRARAAKNKAESFKSYISLYLQPGEKVKDSRVSIGWRTTKSIEIEVPELVPDQFCRIERIPQKTAIKEAIEAGREVPGAKQVSNVSIQIR